MHKCVPYIECAEQLIRTSMTNLNLDGDEKDGRG